LAARIQSRSAAAVLEIARTLVATTEVNLFGETEFTIRDHALGIVAQAYSEHLREKKTATAAPPSIVPTATKRLASMPTDHGKSNPSVD